MRRYLLLAGAALVVAGCASGARPVKQLDTFGYMVGGTLNGPGVEFDPEVTAWARFAPLSFFDVTLGGTVTIPLFEHAAFGGLAELRLHVPLGDYLRVVLDGSAELLRYKLTERRSINVFRYTASPLLVYEQSDITPYFGPKIVYLSNFDADPPSNDGPGLTSNGEGIVMLGGLIGIEDELGGFVIGGTVDVGIAMKGDDVNDAETVAGTVAFYIGY